MDIDKIVRLALQQMYIIDEIVKMVQQTRATVQREPLVDVVDDGDKIRVVVELPGVEKHEIQPTLSEDGATLAISTTGERRYNKTIQLPQRAVVCKNATYKNGVLTIELCKNQQNTKTIPVE